MNFISDFEVAVANEARKLGYQGVVCGHIHHAEIRNIEGMLYCNDGDWVESCSALVEHSDGRLEILKFNPNGNSLDVTELPRNTTDVNTEAEKWVVV